MDTSHPAMKMEDNSTSPASLSSKQQYRQHDDGRTEFQRDTEGHWIVIWLFALVGGLIGVVAISEIVWVQKLFETPSLIQLFRSMFG